MFKIYLTLEYVLKKTEEVQHVSMTIEKSPDLYPGGTPKIVKITGAISALLLVITVVFAIVGWCYNSVAIVYILAAIWGIYPPMWFWYEYFFEYRKKGDRNQFEQFKYGQQISVAIWASVTLLLVSLGSSDHFKTNNTITPPQNIASAPKQSNATDAEQIIEITKFVSGLFVILGGVLGAYSFFRTQVIVAQRFLHIGLNVEPEIRCGHLRISTSVENKGEKPRKITNAFLLIGPESDDHPIMAIRKCINANSSRMGEWASKQPSEDDKEFIDQLITQKLRNTFTDDNTIIVALPFYSDQQDNIWDESLTYEVLVNTHSIKLCVPYVVRFFLFGKGFLYRVTARSFIAPLNSNPKTGNDAALLETENIPLPPDPAEDG